MIESKLINDARVKNQGGKRCKVIKVLKDSWFFKSVSHTNLQQPISTQPLFIIQQEVYSKHLKERRRERGEKPQQNNSVWLQCFVTEHVAAFWHHTHTHTHAYKQFLFLIKLELYMTFLVTPSCIKHLAGKCSQNTLLTLTLPST